MSARACRLEKQVLIDEVRVAGADGEIVTHFLPRAQADVHPILIDQDPPSAADRNRGGGDNDDAYNDDGAAAAAARRVEVDEKGCANARGRRKESSASVWVTFGVGDTVVNGQPLARYFAKASHRAAAMLPLTAALSTPRGYTVRARVKGGGASSFLCPSLLHACFNTDCTVDVLASARARAQFPRRCATSATIHQEEQPRVKKVRRVCLCRHIRAGAGGAAGPRARARAAHARLAPRAQDAGPADARPARGRT